MRSKLAAVFVVFVLAFGGCGRLSPPTAGDCTGELSVADRNAIIEARRWRESRQQDAFETVHLNGLPCRWAMIRIGSSDMQAAIAATPTELVIAGERYQRTEIREEPDAFRDLLNRNAYFVKVK